MKIRVQTSSSKSFSELYVAYTVEAAAFGLSFDLSISLTATAEGTAQHTISLLLVRFENLHNRVKQISMLKSTKVRFPQHLRHKFAVV